MKAKNIKLRKIILTILILLIAIITINSTVMANSGEDINYKDYNPSEPNGYGIITITAGNVLSLVRNIGIAVAVVAITIIGIKYMIGSVEQRAEYKKSMIPFVIGVIILATSTTLVSVIYDFTTSRNQVELPETTDRDRYLYGYEQGRNFIASGPTIEEIDDEIEWAQKKYEETTDPNTKEYYRGYLAGLNT